MRRESTWRSLNNARQEAGEAAARFRPPALPPSPCSASLVWVAGTQVGLGDRPSRPWQVRGLGRGGDQFGSLPLMQDVSCNELTALPQQIGQLKSLRELNVRRNYLKVLPPGTTPGSLGGRGRVWNGTLGEILVAVDICPGDSWGLGRWLWERPGPV